MNHVHAQVLSKFYANFVEGNFQAALDLCAEGMSFQVAGKSPVAGKFTKANFVEGFASKLKSLSNGTYQLEVHEILVSDLHATVLGMIKLTAHGKPVEIRTVHVWRFAEGKPLAGYEYPRDLYQYDAAFSLT